MKNKVIYILVVITVSLMTSCGPNAKEIAEKRIQDSIVRQDSIKKSQWAFLTSTTWIAFTRERLISGSRNDLKFIGTDKVELKVYNVGFESGLRESDIGTYEFIDPERFLIKFTDETTSYTINKVDSIIVSSNNRVYSNNFDKAWKNSGF